MPGFSSLPKRSQDTEQREVSKEDQYPNPHCFPLLLETLLSHMPPFPHLNENTVSTYLTSGKMEKPNM